jgi:hypothetical protein
MRIQVASLSLAVALLGVSSAAYGQVYRLVPNQASEGYRLHTPNGQTYNVAPNYGMQQFGRPNVLSSYTIKRVPGGNGDLDIR